MRALRKFLMVLLVLVLPVQGVAAAFAPLHKAQGTESAAEMPCHGEHARLDAASGNDSDNTTHHNSGNDTNSAGHSCCHQVFSCVPSVEIRAATQKISDTPQTVLLLHTLFVPDSPYRPPRG